MTVQTTTNKAVTMGSTGMKDLKNMVKKHKANQIPVFGYMKVEYINHGQIRVSSYNGDTDVSIERTLDTVHNQEFQAFMIPIEVIKKVKGIKKDSLYTFDVLDSDRIKFSDNGIEQTLMTMNTENYPQFYKLNRIDTTSNGTINHSDLIKLKNATISTAKSESRPILINVVIRNGVATSTDSHRLYQTVLEDVNTENDIFLSQSLIDTLEACEGKDKRFSATISNDGNHVKIETHNVIYTARMSEGNYPDTSRLIPNSFNNVFTIEDVKHFENVVESIYKLVKVERNEVMRLEILNDHTLLISGKSDSGEIETNINISSYGIEKGFKMSFSAKYLLDGIKQLNIINHLEISIVDNLRPFILKDANKQDALSLILPVRPS